jgi:endogenous inhibitor of DNA gyrase (YacG/DUF329 family)
MRKIYTKSKFCVNCGKEYQRKYGEGIKKWKKRRFCSHQCYRKNLEGKISKKRNGEFVKCLICKKEFYRKNKGGKKKFCSMKCYQKYHRNRKDVKCIICGKIFNVNGASRAKYCSKKCYNCDRFYSETKVIKIAREFLKDNGIREKSFKNLLSDKRGKLRFDIYFEKYKLAIEYNGQQHYEYVAKFGNRTLDEVKKSDLLKKEYCKENGIKLLVIKYTEKITNENIIRLIEQCLKKQQ